VSYPVCPARSRIVRLNAELSGRRQRRPVPTSG
jgi:hypothetical protein